MLLTGDMSADGEKKLIALESEDAQNAGQIWDRWRAGHAGSKWNPDIKSCASWLRIFQQRSFPWLDASGLCRDLLRRKNRYGHPHPDALKRLSDCGSEILQTKESGAIIWKTDGHHITWKS